MCNMMKKHNGFTIVELLIVIVVIGILAGISIVAYSGISNQANDAAVQQDLATIAKKVELWKVEKGQYPSTNILTGEHAMNVSKSSYSTTVDLNLLFCSKPPYDTYALLATSNSGKRFYVSSDTNVNEYTGAVSWATNNGTGTCRSILADSDAYGLTGYRRPGSAGTNPGWRPWTGS